jgi:hypothetical protein
VAALLLLLLLRQVIESNVAKLASPFRQFLTSPDASWVESAAIGVFRTLIFVIAMVLIIQVIGRLSWYIDVRLHRWHDAQQGVTGHLAVFLIALLKIAKYVSVLILAVTLLPVMLNFFPARDRSSISPNDISQPRHEMSGGQSLPICRIWDMSLSFSSSACMR